jgi:histidinol-phosphatase (PHP family)
VHSEWSWDTGGPRSDAAGRMEAMCHRAVKMGLPALAFTEHLDITGWAIGQEDLLDHLRPPFDPRAFEDEFRQAMRAVAGSGRALELNVGGLIRP